MKRRLFTILSAISLFLCVAVVVLWVRSQWRTDALTFVAGGSFCYCAVAPEGISIQWLTSLPVKEMPPGESRGWRSRTSSMSWRGTRERPDGPFINVPDATLRHYRFGGIEVSWGSGEILQPIWFIYKKSPLVPFHGISIGWAALLLLSMTIPGVRLALWVRSVWVRRRHGRRGLCLTCGYDLRASKDRCPECGTPIIASEA